MVLKGFRTESLLLCSKETTEQDEYLQKMPRLLYPSEAIPNTEPTLHAHQMQMKNV
jgi:hypothetical protein